MTHISQTGRPHSTWFQRTGPTRPNARGARLAIETLSWRSVLQGLADDEELAATFQDLIPTLGAIPVQKLTPDTLQAFYSDELAAGCGPRTVEMCHQRLS